MAIGGFGVAVAILSVATTAAIVLLAPQPPAMRVSPAAAIAALRKPMPGFERSHAMAPPEGTRLSMIEGILAAELRRPPATVRVVFVDSSPQTSARNRSASGSMTPSQMGHRREPASFVLIENQTGRFKRTDASELSGATRTFLLGMQLPAFSVSVRQPDGQWLIVRPERPFLGGWQISILIALAVSLLLLAPIAWLFARRLTRPFRALADALGERADAVPEEGPRELRDAVAAIARMRNRLADDATERARMLTAIAHDLRTPLTGLRIRLEAAPEPQRARMVADVDRMEAMIGEVLAFARCSATPREEVEVRPLLAQIVADMCDGGATFSLAPGDDASVYVSAVAFRRAVENLIRNANEYAGGGTIDLRRIDDEVLVSVADTGPGIPAGDRERLMRPFERGEASRNRTTGGAGLGLSIVRDFAVQHGGSFTLADATRGGTVAQLRLPLAR